MLSHAGELGFFFFFFGKFRALDEYLECTEGLSDLYTMLGLVLFSYFCFVIKCVSFSSIQPRFGWGGGAGVQLMHPISVCTNYSKLSTCK